MLEFLFEVSFFLTMFTFLLTGISLLYFSKSRICWVISGGVTLFPLLIHIIFLAGNLNIFAFVGTFICLFVASVNIVGFFFLTNKKNIFL